MRGFYTALVRRRRLVLALFAAAVLLCALMRQFVQVNYDINDYLPPETPSTQAIQVLETAFRKGAHLDAWQEYFDLNRWYEAFDECGLDPAFYANRERKREEIFPWSVISCGVGDDYLWRERERSRETLTTPDCRTRCSGCGANKMVGGVCRV